MISCNVQITSLAAVYYSHIPFKVINPQLNFDGGDITADTLWGKKSSKK